KPVLLEGHTAPILAAAWAPSGALLATADAASTVQLWDAGGQPRATLATALGNVYAVAISPDSRTVACAGAAGAIELWDLATQARQATLRPELPYAGTRIGGATGLTAAQREALRALGAVDT